MNNIIISIPRIESNCVGILFSAILEIYVAFAPNKSFEDLAKRQSNHKHFPVERQIRNSHNKTPPTSLCPAKKFVPLPARAPTNKGFELASLIQRF